MKLKEMPFKPPCNQPRIVYMGQIQWLLTLVGTVQKMPVMKIKNPKLEKQLDFQSNPESFRHYLENSLNVFLTKAGLGFLGRIFF